MKVLSVLAIALVLASCNTHTSMVEKRNDIPQEEIQVAGEVVALTFMNDYVQFCNELNTETDIIEWVERNQLTTKQFKINHRKLLEEARKGDPKLGLGFDPIFDAQDYPENGFSVLSQDANGNIILHGKDWSEFAVAVKVKLEDNKWLLDGAGLVNIPEDKRAKR